MCRIKTHPLIAIFLVFGPAALLAQDSASMDDLYKMVQKQQQLIDSQNQQIEAQRQLIEDNVKTLQALSTKLDQVAQAQDMLAGTDTAAPSEEQISLRERLAAIEKTAATEPEMPADVLRAGDFPGAIRIPGTNMEGKVGGNVRLGVVSSFDPIGSTDRFVAGTIPVPGGEPGGSTGDATSGTTISAKRSRMNLDMRMDSSVGQFRAFLEGDFATAVNGSDVYRLRHAFGQYNRFILGQTWSTFMDLKAQPEELDFEGLNSQIFERHPILRWTKGLGNKRVFAAAIEDPTAQIQNGTGKSALPDLVSTYNLRREKWHVQFGLLARNLVAEQSVDGGDGMAEGDQTRTDSTIGWALSASGSHTISKWGQRDLFTWQLSLGEGYGRYVNDLSSIGGQDAVFDPTGNLKALPVFAGNLSFRHYWKRDPASLWGSKKKLLKDVRSTIVYGYVSVDDFDFQPSDAYKQTQRASVNVIWSPIAPIDLGVEFLWGSRKNKDGNKGNATQLQFVATFKF